MSEGDGKRTMGVACPGSEPSGMSGTACAGTKVGGLAARQVAGDVQRLQRRIVEIDGGRYGNVSGRYMWLGGGGCRG
jgi:hypothetical protein